jgi:hypothetical protein
MTDRAVSTRPADATYTTRADQPAGNGRSHKEHRHQGSARAWIPSRARHGPLREKVSLTTMFDRIAQAAAAHDRDAAAEIFGEAG